MKNYQSHTKASLARSTKTVHAMTLRERKVATDSEEIVIATRVWKEIIAARLIPNPDHPRLKTCIQSTIELSEHTIPTPKMMGVQTEAVGEAQKVQQITEIHTVIVEEAILNSDNVEGRVQIPVTAEGEIVNSVTVEEGIVNSVTVEGEIVNSVIVETEIGQEVVVRSGYNLRKRKQPDVVDTVIKKKKTTVGKSGKRLDELLKVLEQEATSLEEHPVALNLLADMVNSLPQSEEQLVISVVQEESSLTLHILAKMVTATATASEEGLVEARNQETLQNTRLPRVEVQVGVAEDMARMNVLMGLVEEFDQLTLNQVETKTGYNLRKRKEVPKSSDVVKVKKFKKNVQKKSVKPGIVAKECQILVATLAEEVGGGAKATLQAFAEIAIFDDVQKKQIDEAKQKGVKRKSRASGKQNTKRKRTTLE